MMSTLYGVSWNMPVGFCFCSGGSTDRADSDRWQCRWNNVDAGPPPTRIGPMRQPLRLISVADALGPLALAHIRVRVRNTPYMGYIILSR